MSIALIVSLTRKSLLAIYSLSPSRATDSQKQDLPHFFGSSRFCVGARENLPLGQGELFDKTASSPLLMLQSLTCRNGWVPALRQAPHGDAPAPLVTITKIGGTPGTVPFDLGVSFVVNWRNNRPFHRSMEATIWYLQNLIRQSCGINTLSI